MREQVAGRVPADGQKKISQNKRFWNFLHKGLKEQGQGEMWGFQDGGIWEILRR